MELDQIWEMVLDTPGISEAEELVWGSIQYSSSYAVYAFCKHYLEVHKITPQELLAKFGIEVTNPVQVLPKEQVLKAYLEDFIAEKTKELEEDEDSDDGFHKEIIEDCLEAYRKLLRGEFTLSSLLDLQRDMAWDLWSAAPDILDSCLAPNQEIYLGSDPFGDDSIGTGISCALLEHFYPEESFDFSDFST